MISGRWKGEHERPCAVKRRLGSERISPSAGFELETPRSEVGSAYRSATRSLGILETLRVKIYANLLLCKVYQVLDKVRIKWQLQLLPYKGANHFKGIHEALSRAGLSIPLFPWNRLSRRTAKPTKWPAKWRLRSTWASTLSDQSSLSARRNLGSVATHWVHSEDSDQTG